MLKSLLIGLVALLVLATGATAASPKQKVKNVNRLCVWVESGNNTPDTAWDLKIKKAYTANVKTCIVGKQGKTGKQGKQGKTGAKGATGAQGLMGIPGAQGLMGTPGAQGLQGIAALAGKNGLDGGDGSRLDGRSNGWENCADGGSVFTAATGHLRLQRRKGRHGIAPARLATLGGRAILGRRAPGDRRAWTTAPRPGWPGRYHRACGADGLPVKAGFSGLVQRLRRRGTGKSSSP